MSQKDSCRSVDLLVCGVFVHKDSEAAYKALARMTLTSHFQPRIGCRAGILVNKKQSGIISSIVK